MSFRNVGRPRQYPFEEWFKRGHISLIGGVDFCCSRVMLAQQLRSAASKLGYSLNIQETSEGFNVLAVKRQP